MLGTATESILFFCCWFYLKRGVSSKWCQSSFLQSLVTEGRQSQNKWWSMRWNEMVVQSVNFRLPFCSNSESETMWHFEYRCYLFLLLSWLVFPFSTWFCLLSSSLPFATTQQKIHTWKGPDSLLPSNCFWLGKNTHFTVAITWMQAGRWGSCACYKIIISHPADAFIQSSSFYLCQSLHTPCVLLRDTIFLFHPGCSYPEIFTSAQ